ncbi:hypothetical protein AGDE_00271 [Angomonas deanei]|nr:hypothetical protein AGDE_00271 [Angomonas deanei]|eukprot:EPY43650.1 hypothetical protein AGDE_00271 [Angomonas deanei]
MFDSRHPTFVYDCNNFLRYTGPLYFESSGNYIVQAHVVNPSLKTVGAIHQFQYILMLNESGFRSPSRRGSTPRHNTNTIDINYNRQYSEENNNNNNQVAIYNNTASVVPYSNALLQAPVIIPGSGEVTAGTRIRLEHSRQSAQLNIQNVNLYYSLDGSPPSTLYTEPFPLFASNLSSPTQGSKVHIKAIAIGAVTNNNQNNGNSSTSVSSPVAQAHLTVRPAGYSYYDPSVSSPSARVRTVNALLYFDESKNPPRTKTVYQFIFISEVRAYALYEATDKKKSDPSFLLPGKKLKFNKNKCFTYSGEPIPITEDLAQIYAWTVDEDFLESNNFDVDDEAAMRQRSGAAIYDCTYATAMQLDPSKRRSSDHQAATSFLPAPVLCISCSDVELEFEEPPAHCLIAYTLNGKEPALYDVDPPACAAPLPALSAHRRGGDHAVTNTPRKRTDVTGDLEGMNTYIYRVNKIIKISLLSAETVHVTARVFLPVYEDGSGQVRGNYGGQGGSGGTLLGYRYGDVFHRAFYFSGN